MTPHTAPKTAPESGTDEPVTWCPSGAADAPESVVLGVRSGDGGEVIYLADPVPAADVLGAIPEGIEPRRVLRFASHCVANCANRRGTQCSLVDRVVAADPGRDTAAAPRCHLRARCQWWTQAGLAACRRCPAVSSLHHTDEELATLVAEPTTTLDQLNEWIAERN
ncbi:hypothetical protein ACFQVC_39500 [Streptomyces monticola]|uniref:Nitrogen fixation protein n=1 Tax=Streptomyces monticola TaxID=2666263 RepID=A0ABW2JXP6_9ACTN